MKRLEAARQIRHGLTVHFSNGDKRVYQTFHPEDDSDDSKPVIFCINPHTNEFSQMKFPDVLRMIRWNYPRTRGDSSVTTRDDGATMNYNSPTCKHRYEVWSDNGRHLICKANCTCPQEHFHCKSCGDAETATGLYSRLCHKCTKESNTVRADITKQMMEYQFKFGIPFTKDEEVVEYYSDCPSYTAPKSDREDFHADG